jgi:hypothetical protein
MVNQGGMKWQGPDLTQKKWGKSATQFDVVLSLRNSPLRSLSLLSFSHCQSFCHVSVTICQSFALCLFSIRVNKKLRLSKQFLWSPAGSFYSIIYIQFRTKLKYFIFMKNIISRYLSMFCEGVHLYLYWRQRECKLEG